jgi:hypothetical protein
VWRTRIDFVEGELWADTHRTANCRRDTHLAKGEPSRDTHRTGLAMKSMGVPEFGSRDACVW